MKQTFLAGLLSVVVTCFLQGQAIYLCTSSNGLLRLNMDNCNYTFVCQVDRQVYDIAFHPDGTLYGISGNGNFFRIDTINGNTAVLHDFDGQSFNSLTIGSNGIVYTIGNQGLLWTYNLSTTMASFLGDIGFDATGDLTFYKGELYCAVTGDRIVNIPVSNINNTTVAINDDIPGNILGIVSDVVDCTEINCYAITNGLSDIYLINFQTQSLDLVCQLNVTIGGGASTSEFLASSPLEIDSIQLMHPGCMQNNGSAAIFATGGYGMINFSLNESPGQPNNDFSTLTEGMYRVIVTDQSGCEDTIDFELSTPTAPMIDSVLTSIETCGAENGSLTAFVSGGTPPYSFSLNNESLTESSTFPGLRSGMYHIAVIDQDGCRDSTSTSVGEWISPAIDSIQLSMATCDLHNASLLIHATQGSGFISYSLNGGTSQEANFFQSLSPGTYEVNIMDSVGCSDVDTVILEGLPSYGIAEVEVNHTTCGLPNGSILITPDQPDDMLFSINVGPTTPNTFFDQLPSGSYTIVSSDVNGCLDSITVVIESSIGPVISSIQSTPDTCGQANGTILLTTSGGTGSLMYALDGGMPQSSGTFTSLSAGGYAAFVMDETGCLIAVNIIVDLIEGIESFAIQTLPSACDQKSGIIELEIIGGAPPYEVILNNQLQESDHLFDQLAAGTYIIQVKDASGCQADTIALVDKDPCPIYIPNVFSPNGDGVNDFFRVQASGNENVMITRFYIFDRWGNEVYVKENFTTQSEDGWWDGTHKRFTMNPGVFAYFLEVRFENGEIETYKGDVTLLR